MPSLTWCYRLNLMTCLSSNVQALDSTIRKTETRAVTHANAVG